MRRRRDVDGGSARSRPFVVAAVAASALLPGTAHLRLGAVPDGLVYLAALAVVNAAQFGAPFLEPTAQAAATLAGLAFVLGLILSVVAARSAARLARAD
jgi:hypothetical protein